MRKSVTRPTLQVCCDTGLRQGPLYIRPTTATILIRLQPTTMQISQVCMIFFAGKYSCHMYVSAGLVRCGISCDEASGAVRCGESLDAHVVVLCSFQFAKLLTNDLPSRYNCTVLWRQGNYRSHAVCGRFGFTKTTSPRDPPRYCSTRWVSAHQHKPQRSQKHINEWRHCSVCWWRFGNSMGLPTSRHVQYTSKVRFWRFSACRTRATDQLFSHPALSWDAEPYAPLNP